MYSLLYMDFTRKIYICIKFNDYAARFRQNSICSIHSSIRKTANHSIMSTTDKCLKETTEYSAEDARFMEMAINLSVENIDTGGGPFGAVIVRDGEIIATGANRVVPNSDPTAHAEVMAIRNACAKLGTFQLTGCTVYSSCEPCPMCLSALYWAGVSRICYGNTKDDAKAINFDDSFIYDQLDLKYDERSIKCEHFMRSDALRAFRKWEEKEDKVEY